MSKRPRCRRCGATLGLLASDGACYEAFACGERVGAKGERVRIKRGVVKRRGFFEDCYNLAASGKPDRVRLARCDGAIDALDEVLAAVRGRK